MPARPSRDRVTAPAHPASASRRSIAAGQRGAAFRRVEVAGQLAYGRIVEPRLPVERSAGGEDEQRAADRGIPLVVLERDFLSGDVREDDEVDVASGRQAAYSSAIASASSRMPMPSSISSRVIVSGGHTMITFQCVIR